MVLSVQKENPVVLESAVKKVALVKKDVLDHVVRLEQMELWVSMVNQEHQVQLVLVFLGSTEYQGSQVLEVQLGQMGNAVQLEETARVQRDQKDHVERQELKV